MSSIRPLSPFDAMANLGGYTAQDNILRQRAKRKEKAAQRAAEQVRSFPVSALYQSNGHL